MNTDLAAALTALITAAARAPAATEPTTADAFAALLAGTTPAPAPQHPVRCPRTGGIYMFVQTAAEAEVLTARLAA